MRLSCRPQTQGPNSRTTQCSSQGRGRAALTACLHQEQLMATISLLWKVNFCWKP
jgi:hypothetical protein